jgi:uncharacterized protein YbjT (DUF2867 family)
MSDRTTVLVTGISGNVGSATAGHLLEAGAHVRGLARDPEKARRIVLDSLEAQRHPAETHGEPRAQDGGAAPTDRGAIRQVGGAAERLHIDRFDFVSHTPTPTLFDGVRRLFLMRPPSIGDVETHMFPFLAAAKATGVEHVVLLSLMGAQRMPFIPHRKLEKEIARQELAYSFLRAGFFMQNLDTVFAEFIRDFDELPVPAGGGKTSFVDTRDLGEAAAKLLLSADDTAAFELTGAEALDYDEVARILSRELGRSIRYTRPSLRAFKRRVREAGWDPGFTKIVGRLYYTVRFGIAAKVTDDLGRILGRAPRTMSQYVHDYRAAWISR